MKIVLKNTLFVLCLLLSSKNLRAQEKNPYQGYEVLWSVNPPKNTTFYVYDPPFKAKAIYYSMDEVTNEYPEQLMSSSLSVDNQKWYDANMLPSSGLRELQKQEVFDRAREMNRDSIYYELSCKLEFTYQGETMCLMKFYIHLSHKESYAGAVVMQRQNGRWYETVTPFTTSLALVMIQIKTEYLQQIFEGKPTKDKYVDDLIKKIQLADGSISTARLIKESNGWRENKQTDIINYFKDPKSW